jgi:hypothetical protein
MKQRVQSLYLTIHDPYPQCSNTLTACFLRPSLFWDFTRRRLVVGYRRLGTTYRYHLQDWSSKLPTCVTKNPWRVKALTTQLQKHQIPPQRAFVFGYHFGRNVYINHGCVSSNGSTVEYNMTLRTNGHKIRVPVRWNTVGCYIIMFRLSYRLTLYRV